MKDKRSDHLTDAERLVYAAAFGAASVAFDANGGPGGGYRDQQSCALAGWLGVVKLRGDVDALRRSVDWPAVEAMLVVFKAMINIHSVALAKLAEPKPGGVIAREDGSLATFNPGGLPAIESGSRWRSKYLDRKTVVVSYANLNSVTYRIDGDPIPGTKRTQRRDKKGPPVHYGRARFLGRFVRIGG